MSFRILFLLREKVTHFVFRKISYRSYFLDLSKKSCSALADANKMIKPSTNIRACILVFPSMEESITCQNMTSLTPNCIKTDEDVSYNTIKHQQPIIFQTKKCFDFGFQMY